MTFPNAATSVLLDLFCKAGGATRGYQMAGFYVVGVDIEPQPRYVGDEFFQMDAFEFMETQDLSRYTAIHGSPPCQGYTVLKNLNKKVNAPKHVEKLRECFIKSGKPYVIENVPGAPLENPVLLCGSVLGPKVEHVGYTCEVRRHRLFESNVPLVGSGCQHGNIVIPSTDGGGGPNMKFRRTVSVAGHGEPVGPRQKYGGNTPLSIRRAVMGIDWMNRDELGEAIPPAYAFFIGKQLIQVLR